MTPAQPPPLATWLLRYLGGHNEALIGDLFEEFRRTRSSRWYCKQVVAAIVVAHAKPLWQGIVSVVALGAGLFVAVSFLEPIVAFVTASLRSGGQMVDRFDARLLSARIAALAALVLAAPAIFYQLWQQVAPESEARRAWLAGRFVGFATGAFMAGIGVAHYVVFPAVWRVLIGFMTESRLESAFSLYAKLLLTSGLVTVLPMAVLLLARVGAVTRDDLVRRAGYALLLTLVVAGVLTPTGDAITLWVASAPFLAAYGLSVLLAWGFGRSIHIEYPPPGHELSPPSAGNE